MTEVEDAIQASARAHEALKRLKNR
jgi:hypothetical protein